MDKCEVTATDNTADILRRVAQEIMNNMVVLLLALAILALVAVLAIAIVRMIVDTVRRHRLSVFAPAPGPSERAERNRDDVEYKGGRKVELPPEPEGPKIRAKLAEIKALYSSYNKAIATYAFGTKGREPDDIIDERVLSRKNDDFKYDDRAPGLAAAPPFPGPPPQRAPADGSSSPAR